MECRGVQVGNVLLETVPLRSAHRGILLILPYSIRETLQVEDIEVKPSLALGIWNDAYPLQ